MAGSGEHLRALVADDLVVVPGCADALEATLVERAGFAAVYVSGFAVSAGLAAFPDLGLLGFAEIEQVVRRICRSVQIPVIADADTGFGGPLNVRRTVEELELAGVAGIQIEDQVNPKRCGHFDGKQVVPTDEAVARVRVAAEARSLAASTVLVARTDAAAAEGIDAAVERARRFVDVGADVIFIEAIRSEQDLERVATALPGVPLLYNLVEGGRSPAIDRELLRNYGVRILLHPITVLLERVRMTMVVLERLAHGTVSSEVIDLVKGVVGADEMVRYDEALRAPDAG